jgi:hypothetical protein
MRRLLIALTALTLATTTSQAKPVRLACEGTITLVRSTAQRILSVAIDEAGGTITVDGYGTATSLGPIGDQDDKLVFLAQRGAATGVSSVVFDRFTGEASIHIITDDGLLKFYGKCSPARRLL